jgi:DNA-binding CsgD family transcriptional regulator
MIRPAADRKAVVTSADQLPEKGSALGDAVAKPSRGRQPRPLTKRQLDILRMIAQGRTTDEIGRQLDISKYTVRDHMLSIFTKLNAVNRAHAVAVAMREGLLR